MQAEGPIDASGTAPSRRPPSVPEPQWAVVMPGDEDEAIERMGFLTMRGLSPVNAFNAAIKGMDDDQNELGEHHSTTWHVLHVAARTRLLPWRRLDGRYVPAILELARSVEETGRAMAGLEGRIEDFHGMGLPEGAADRLLEAAIRRRDEHVAFQTMRFLSRADDPGLPPDDDYGDHDGDSPGY